MIIGLILLATLGGASVGFQGLGRYIYNYRLNSDRIEVVLFGQIPVMKIPYSDIIGVREVSLKDTLKPDFTTLRLGNRIFGPIVEIQRKSTIFKRILITPDNAQEFTKQVVRALKK